MFGKVYTLPTSKETVREYGIALKSGAAGQIIKVILALIFVLAIIPGAFMREFYFLVVLYMIGLIMYGAWLGAEKRLVKGRMANSFAAPQSTLEFFEDYFTLNNAISKANYSYAAVSKVIKTRNLLIVRLHTGNDILINGKYIPRQDFAEIEDAFIQKIAIPIKSANRFFMGLSSTAGKVIFWITVIFIFLFAGEANDEYFSMPKEFEVGNFSITAAQVYEITDSVADDVYLKDSLKDTAIRANFVSDEDIEKWGHQAGMTSKEYAERFIVTDIIDWTEDDILEIDDTHTMVHMVESVNNYEIYNMSVVVRTEGGYWVTKFTCDGERYPDYYENFLEYAGSIK